MEDRILKDYGYYLKIERGMSPNTVASYSSDIEALLKETGKMPAAISTDDVCAYLAGRGKQAGGAGKSHLEDGGISKRSQARMLSAFKSFFEWLVMEGEINLNPCDGIATPKLGRYLPDVLSVEEVDAIIGSVSTASAQGKRDRAILEVLYGCGLRVSECSKLRISSVWMDDGFVRVTGKGDKERIIPLGDMASEALSAWLEVRPEPADTESEDIMFLNRSGHRLSRVSIFKMIKKQALEAGIRKEISPHTFRHSFATHMIENGADLRVVQEMLGHESILTTEIYTHIDKSTWQSAVLKHHPRCNKND